MITDPDVLDYISRVIAVDGFVWPHVQNAINDFVLGCKADPSPIAGTSNWDAMKACCLLAGAQTYLAALVPLKGPAPTNFNFTSADYHPALGLKGDNGNKRLNTHRSGTDDPQDNCHLAIFLTEPNSFPASGSAGFAGQESSINAPQRAIFRHAGVKANSLELHGQLPQSVIGFIGVSRHAPEFSLGLQSNDLTSMPFQSAEPSPSEIGIFARNAAGATGTNMRCSFYSAGQSVNLPALEMRITRYMQDIQMPTRRGFPLSRLVN